MAQVMWLPGLVPADSQTVQHVQQTKRKADACSCIVGAQVNDLATAFMVNRQAGAAHRHTRLGLLQK